MLTLKYNQKVMNHYFLGVGGSSAPTGIFKLSANGKVSTSHSRNSSLVEDNDGYVPMIPGQHR